MSLVMQLPQAIIWQKHEQNLQKIFCDGQGILKNKILKFSICAIHEIYIDPCIYCIRYPFPPPSINLSISIKLLYFVVDKTEVVNFMCDDNDN